MKNFVPMFFILMFTISFQSFAATKAEVVEYAKRLGVEEGLAVEETKDNLEVIFEQKETRYKNKNTLNQEIATAYFVSVVMNTGESYEFFRAIIVDSKRLNSLSAIIVQRTYEE